MQYRLNAFSSYGLGKLSSDPPIFMMPYLGDRYDPFLYIYNISRRFISKNVYYLCAFYWYVSPKTIKDINKFMGRFNRFFKRHKIIFLANSQEELDLLKGSNIQAIFCNNNSFIDEKIFKPTGSGKIYDAVYDARLSKFKRHELCTGISSLALITYFHRQGNENEYFSKIREMLSFAYWYNFDDEDNYRKLNDTEVNAANNQCRVGLCLSEEEGAMFASIQYLLAGLPIVNTPNRGGRDLFFDGYNSITVEPRAEKVAQAVRELIEKKPNPQVIRQNAIKIMTKHRNRFIALVNRIYQKEAVPRDFGKEWDTVFHNKFLRWGGYKKII